MAFLWDFPSHEKKSQSHGKKFLIWDFFGIFDLGFFWEKNPKNPGIWDMGFGIPEKSHPKATSGSISLFENGLFTMHKNDLELPP